MSTRFVLFFQFIFFLSACYGQYTNPVFKPCFADPTVIQAPDGYFYCYATTDNWGDGARIVPVIRSTNLVDWTYIGDAFQSKPSWIGKANIWAPDINYFKGKYYLFYAYSVWGDPNPGIGYAVSDGPFTDKGKIFDSRDIGVPNSIDPAIFIEDDRIYLVWGSFNGIYINELSFQDQGFAIKGPKKKLAGNRFEAPYIQKNNDFYYLFLSVGSCCEGVKSSYHIVVSRSNELMGEYSDIEGNEVNDDQKNAGSLVIRGNDQWAGPGHQSQMITDSNGTQWMLYHAIDKADPYFSGAYTKRPLMLDPVIWEDGWPEVNGQQPSKKVSKPDFR